MQSDVTIAKGFHTFICSEINGKGNKYGVRQFISYVPFYISIFDVLNTSMSHQRARAMSPFIKKCNIIF